MPAGGRSAADDVDVVVERDDADARALHPASRRRKASESAKAWRGARPTQAGPAPKVAAGEAARATAVSSAQDAAERDAVDVVVQGLAEQGAAVERADEGRVEREAADGVVDEVDGVEVAAGE